VAASAQERAAAAGGGMAPTHVAGDALLWELARKRPDRPQHLAACEGATALFREQHGQARRRPPAPAAAARQARAAVVGPLYTVRLIPAGGTCALPLTGRRSRAAPAEPGPPAGVCGCGGPLLREQRAQRGHRVVDHARPAHVRARIPGARTPPGPARMRRAVACGMLAALLAALRSWLQASGSSLRTALGHKCPAESRGDCRARQRGDGASDALIKLAGGDPTVRPSPRPFCMHPGDELSAPVSRAAAWLRGTA